MLIILGSAHVSCQISGYYNRIHSCPAQRTRAQIVRTTSATATVLVPAAVAVVHCRPRRLPRRTHCRRRPQTIVNRLQQRSRPIIVAAAFPSAQYPRQPAAPSLVEYNSSRASSEAAVIVASSSSSNSPK